MEAPQNSFASWAVVELFGHVKEIGYVTTQFFGTACLFQIDTPAIEDREIELQVAQWVEDSEGTSVLAGKGSKTKRPGSPAKTRLVGPGAIYSMTPCTQATAYKALEEFSRRPFVLLELVKDEPPKITWPADEEGDDSDTEER